MDDGTARRLLGIGPQASIQQAREAYKRRAKMIHPDRHAYASAEARREAERAMAELNEAWRALRTGSTTREASQRRDAGRHSTGKHSTQRSTTERRETGRAYASYEPPAATQPGADRAWPHRPRARGCEICGYTPAIWIDIRALTGLVIFHRSDRYAATLCRYCGTAIWRDVQAQTLTLGWWGVPALFINLAVLVNNRTYGVALRELEPPQARVADSGAPLSEPIALTKRVATRVLPWLAMVALLVLVTLLVVALVQARG
ncbi:J domain-containing protein [Haloechinothrix sp. LS1_15]|uniref:J domain-containing protein n=1 Tax=Haloechinothrix sp. LS1_15 TaxID=2652248 RepID=UPI00294ACBE2|nr:J domain-containing protein [Haloechinothrix sp. LS1_15]